MDTKWKKRKKIVSFIMFFLGVSLSLGSFAEILRLKPAGVRIWQLDRMLEDDYQIGIASCREKIFLKI